MAALIPPSRELCSSFSSDEGLPLPEGRAAKMSPSSSEPLSEKTIQERRARLAKMIADDENEKKAAEQRYAALSPEERAVVDMKSRILRKRMNQIPLSDEELKWQSDRLTTEFKKRLYRPPDHPLGKQ